MNPNHWAPELRPDRTQLSGARSGYFVLSPPAPTCALPATQLDSIVAALEKTTGIDATVGRYAAEDARRFASLGS